MQIIQTCCWRQHANMVFCSRRRAGEARLHHLDPQIISLCLMFLYFSLSQLMPVKTRFPFEEHALHNPPPSQMPEFCLLPGVWSSTQTTSRLSWLWQWAWPTLVCATMLVRPCFAGCDTTQSTRTCWRAKTTWWDPRTPNGGCLMLPMWADMKGTVLKLNSQFNSLPLLSTREKANKWVLPADSKTLIWWQTCDEWCSACFPIKSMLSTIICFTYTASALWGRQKLSRSLNYSRNWCNFPGETVYMNLRVFNLKPLLLL